MQSRRRQHARHYAASSGLRVLRGVDGGARRGIANQKTGRNDLVVGSKDHSGFLQYVLLPRLGFNAGDSLPVTGHQPTCASAGAAPTTPDSPGLTIAPLLTLKSGNRVVRSAQSHEGFDLFWRGLVRMPHARPRHRDESRCRSAAKPLTGLVISIRKWRGLRYQGDESMTVLTADPQACESIESDQL